MFFMISVIVVAAFISSQEKCCKNENVPYYDPDDHGYNYDYLTRDAELEKLQKILSKK